MLDLQFVPQMAANEDRAMALQRVLLRAHQGEAKTIGALDDAVRPARKSGVFAMRSYRATPLS